MTQVFLILRIPNPRLQLVLGRQAGPGDGFDDLDAGYDFRNQQKPVFFFGSGWSNSSACFVQFSKKNDNFVFKTFVVDWFWSSLELRIPKKFNYVRFKVWCGLKGVSCRSDSPLRLFLRSKDTFLLRDFLDLKFLPLKKLLPKQRLDTKFYSYYTIQVSLLLNLMGLNPTSALREVEETFLC